MAWFREEGLLTVSGVPYRAYREAWMRGPFLLETAGTVLARAEKPSALQRRLLVEFEGRRFTLQPRSLVSRDFILLDDGAEAGRIVPEGLLTRRAQAHLPEAMPLPVKVFLMWLVILLWKRAADSSS